MKICILTTDLNHGGATIIAQDVARGMAQKGHDVLFVCSGEKPDSYLFDGYHVQILSNNCQNPIYHYVNPLLMAKFHYLLRHFKPDILHVHNINLQTFSLCVLLFSLKYPMVWTLHDLWPLCMTGWPTPPDCNQLSKQCHDCPTWPTPIVKINKILKENIFRLSKMSIVCPSKWIASLLKVSNLHIHPTHINFNGIDSSLFPPMGKNRGHQSSEISNKKKVLLFCGGKKLAGQLPAERKGWNDLVTALKIIACRQTDTRLVYVGDPIDLPSSFPVPISFEIGVNREEMKNLYRIADLFILPTLAENSPLTIIEAMACKVPIIATNVGGIPEMIIPGETGLLCPSHDAVALAENIEYALSNPEHCSEMAEKAYQRFNEMFTFERMIEQYEDVYKKTIAGWVP